jgi:hypothetical protein
LAYIQQLRLKNKKKLFQMLLILIAFFDVFDNKTSVSAMILSSSVYLKIVKQSLKPSKKLLIIDVLAF